MNWWRSPWLWLPAVLVAALWAAWPFLGPVLARSIFRIPLDGEDLAAYGQFGDLFGVLNALFSAAAFALLWVTTQLQGRELKEAQRLARRQAFENRFFNQSSLFKETVRELRFQPGEGGAGHLVIRRSAELVRACLTKASENLGDSPSTAEIRADLVQRYDAFFMSQFKSVLSPYFRTLYYLIDSVDQADWLLKNEKRKYVNIVRGYLSHDDVLLIAFNGIVEPQFGLKAQIENYGLLKHLPVENRVAILIACFERGAFEGMSERH